MENTREKEITLKSLFTVLKKCFIVMIIAAVVAGAAAGVYITFAVDPSYKGTTTFWVNTASTKYDYTSQAQTAAATQIATSCLELVSAEMPVRRAVREKLVPANADGTELTSIVLKYGFASENAAVSAVRRCISARKDNETTFVFSVSASGGNKEFVFDVLTALEKVMPEVIDELVKLEVNNENGKLLTVITSINNIDNVSTIKTSAPKTAILAAVVVAVLVYLVYFVISLFDTVVYDENSIKNNFNYPIVGNIPNWANSNDPRRKNRRKKKLHEHGIDVSTRDYTDRLLSTKAPFAIAEAFNLLRTNVIFSAGASNSGKVVAITSAISGAGKSLVSANLALSLANLGKKTLLVECDMRCPSMGRIFKEKKQAGLSELLAGIESDYKALVHDAPDSTLNVLFSGKIPPNPSELLSSESMSALLFEMRKEYDFIILDMPPIGEVVDAGVVSGLIDGYLVAVRCDYSDIKDVRRATEALVAVEGKIFGFILNDCNPKNAGKYKRAYYNPEAKYSIAKNGDI